MSPSVLLVAVFAGRTWGNPHALCTLNSPEISESSGVAASQEKLGVFYTHNDSGDSARFFRFDRTGRVTGEFKLKGVKAIDWEDMASAHIGNSSWLYLADCGDNNRKRDSIQVHKVKEPSGPGVELKDFDTYTITYPDKKRDCEAVMVDPKSGDIWFVTKARDGETVAYRLRSPKKTGTYKLEKMAVLDIGTHGIGGTWVTGGDISPDGKHVVLRTYTGALEFDAPSDFAKWVEAEPRAIKTAAEQQGEAIAFSRDGSTLVTTTEGKSSVVSMMTLQK